EREKLFYSAIVGMLKDLDQHSEFMVQDEAQDFRSTIDQRFEGVGIELNYDGQGKRVTISNLFVGSPAYKADVRPRDRIESIAGKLMRENNFTEVRKLIRGPIGSAVKVTLERPGEKKPIEVSLERSVVQTDSVFGDSRNPDDSWNFQLAKHPEIGYIR